MPVKSPRPMRHSARSSQPILDAGAATDTLVVLTSDHGESLGEHGEATHGIFAYESTLRVPLVLYYPPLLAPRVIDTAASHVDIVPIILETLGLPPVAGLRGRTMADFAREPADDPVTYFEALSGSLNRGWAPLSGVVSNGMKFIDLPIPELYDLRIDPRELRNLAETRPQELAERRALLQSFEAPEVRRVDETSEVKERLRALGYVASSSEQLAADLHRGGRSQTVDSGREQICRTSSGSASRAGPRTRSRVAARSWRGIRTCASRCCSSPTSSASRGICPWRSKRCVRP